MPNIRVTKHDGETLSIPPKSITAILATTYYKPEEGEEERRCTVMTNIGGLKFYSLRQTAREIRAMIETAVPPAPRGINLKRRPKAEEPAPWIALQSGDDITFIPEGSPFSFEGTNLTDLAEPAHVLRVHFNRHDGQAMWHDVDHTPANEQTLDAAIERREQA